VDVANHLDAVRLQPLREDRVGRLDHGVAGHDDLLELALAHLLVEGRRVERVRAHRLVGLGRATRRRRGHEPVVARQVVAGGEPRRRVVGHVRQRELVRDPPGRVADREHDAAAEPRPLLLAERPDRVPFEEDQQDHRDADHQDRVAGSRLAAVGCGGNVVDAFGHVRSEPEVDEGGHAAAGDGGTHDDDNNSENGPQ
jgi:hypothetical protein